MNTHKDLVWTNFLLLDHSIVVIFIWNGGNVGKDCASQNADDEVYLAWLTKSFINDVVRMHMTISLFTEDHDKRIL